MSNLSFHYLELLVRTCTDLHKKRNKRNVTLKRNSFIAFTSIVRRFNGAFFSVNCTAFLFLSFVSIQWYSSIISPSLVKLVWKCANSISSPPIPLPRAPPCSVKFRNPFNAGYFIWFVAEYFQWNFSDCYISSKIIYIFLEWFERRKKCS